MHSVWSCMLMSTAVIFDRISEVLFERAFEPQCILHSSRNNVGNRDIYIYIYIVSTNWEYVFHLLHWRTYCAHTLLLLPTFDTFASIIYTVPFYDITTFSIILISNSRENLSAWSNDFKYTDVISLQGLYDLEVFCHCYVWFNGVDVFLRSLLPFLKFYYVDIAI